MLKVNINQLVAAVQQAAPFTPPEMDKGTKYLFNNIYSRLSCGEVVRLPDLDFNAFSADDIDSLNDLYKEVFERDSLQAGGIAGALRMTAPVCKTAAYV